MTVLASVERVEKTQLIQGEPSLSLVFIEGQGYVTEKRMCKTGELMVCLRPGAFLTNKDLFDDISFATYRNNPYMGEGYLVSQKTIRGIHSSGVLLPMTLLPDGDYFEGEDVAPLLSVKSWIFDSQKTELGMISGERPKKIPSLRPDRMILGREKPRLIEEISFYALSSMPGVHCAYYDGGVCGNKYAYHPDSRSVLFQHGDEHGLFATLRNRGPEWVMMGILCGPGISSNLLELESLRFYCYDLYNTDTETYMDFEQYVDTCLGSLINVPEIITAPDHYSLTEEKIFDLARGKYSSGVIQNGITLSAKRGRTRENRASVYISNPDRKK